MTVSQNVFKGFSLFGKLLASPLDQTDLNQFLKVPIHVFPIYDPRWEFHTIWRKLSKLHSIPALQNLLWTNLWRRPLNLSTTKASHCTFRQFTNCLSASPHQQPASCHPPTFFRGNRCIDGDAMSTSRRRGTDWRRWRRLWRAHRTDKRRILGLSFVFHRDHHHQMIRWSDDVSDDDEEDDDEEDDDVDQNVDAAAAAVSRFFKFWSVWSWSLRRDNDGVRWVNKPACLSIC